MVLKNIGFFYGPYPSPPYGTNRLVLGVDYAISAKNSYPQTDTAAGGFGEETLRYWEPYIKEKNQSLEKICDKFNCCKAKLQL